MPQSSRPKLGLAGSFRKKGDFEIDPICETRRDAAAPLVAVDLGSEGERQRALAIGIGPQPPADRLLAAGVDLRAEAFEHAELAVARGPDVLRRGSGLVGPIRPAPPWDRRVLVREEASRSSFARVCQLIPRRSPASRHRPAVGPRANRWAVRWASSPCGHFPAGLEPARNHLPHRPQGILGGIAGGAETG